MPVSKDLLKALAEDPKSLEHQLGCMAGLFQIFDRQALGRRYGSKRVSNAGSGQSQPTSACETPRHDHHHHPRHNINPYWMFEEDSSQRISGDTFAVPKEVDPHHRPAYSDSSDIFTKSFETPTDSRTSPDEKSNLDLSPMYSEESSVMGAWDPSRDCTTSRYASFEHHHDERSELRCAKKTLNVIVPARAAPASDIRDIVRASFERDHQRPSIPNIHKEKPRLSVDAGSHGQYLKTLPRSASVDGKDRSSVAVAVADAPQAARHAPVDLPRSSSVGGRGPSRMLDDWKDGLRSSTGSPRLTSKERDAFLLKQKPAEGRDVTRLTVELKEGPRLSVSVDDRRSSVDASPRLISRFRDVPGEIQPSFNRAADIKEFLRREKKVNRVEHRFSVDGTRDAPRACIAPRLSVDGRDNETAALAALAARKLKLLDPKDPNYEVNFCRQSSGRKASNVVARLMGLDELVPKETMTTTTPNKSATRFANLETELYDQAFLHNPEFSPPPPPSPPDDYDYAHHAADHDAFHHGRQTQRFNESSSIHDHFASKHQQLYSQANNNSSSEDLVTQQSYNFKALAIVPSEDQSAKQQEDESVYLCKSSDEPLKDAQSVARKAPQGRRSLWHIFEAMQFKGLLHGSSRRKQAEALRLHNVKEKDGLDEKEQRRSQSLPPRLSISAAATELHNGDRLPDVFPRPLLEVHKVSGLEPAQANEEAAFVGVKPIITRPMSCKAPAASLTPSTQPCAQPFEGVSANIDSGRKYHLAEDTTLKNLSRAMSKSAGAYHREAVSEQEPLLQQVAESSSQSANGRQPRKERERGVGAAAAAAKTPATTATTTTTTTITAAAARVTKSASEFPQREQQQRDSSLRFPRVVGLTNNTPQDSIRPARSCSLGSVSPRYPGSLESGTLRVMEAGKVRRKAVAVKDREESKASLVHLRANATKQEFLKERASGDPDTPRLLMRRSSSESKLLSKIVEKATAPADSGSSAKASRSGNSPSMSLLRPKRPVAKDSNKSPMKTPPISALGGLKSVAKSKERAENMQASNGICRPAKPASECGLRAAQAQQPAEVKSDGTFQDVSRCEVRATHDGALDQSGDTAHANVREEGVRTEPKAREKSIEIDEGVKTPRGVSIKKIDFSEDAQADVAEQPSPVSVLDNSHFDEELTPSPKAGKTSVVSLQEQNQRSEKDRRWNSARFLDLDQLEETPPSLNPPESSLDAPSLPAPPAPLPSQHQHQHQHQRVCLKDADEESSYVEELLRACTFPSDYVLDPLTFDHLESQRGGEHEEALDRRLLFDCVGEVLERLLGTQLRPEWRPELRPELRHRLMRTRRVGLKEVMAELADIPCAAAEEESDTVYVILQKDFVKGRGEQWSDHHKELQEVGVAVERMIVKDLVEETVRELIAGSATTAAASGGLQGTAASRRQLFI